ncbi:RNA-binding family protein with RRM/RBD/RNP motifs [Prunus dulcis]|uniref:RNA-binding family protein with RRM/RBD/RNP motifs n=1 Tax=Prunus dulcis TaxID=3755 RepID=A0A4Y1RKH0_PRUDU|nr:RNA-binding family protein with RRM/RBD/RNP motifs [Prunus dulcis]
MGHKSNKMQDPLNMSLDDLIKTSKKSGSGNARGRGRASGPGPARRLPNRAANRTTPYAAAKAPETAWQHDLYTDQGAAAFPAQAGRASAIETGTKLYISNLDYGVSNEDIKELFSEVGDLKRYGVHYDRSGRSKGTAEVVFSRRPDAVAAVKRYNNVQLDGKPMKIEIVGTNISTPGGPPTLPLLLMATLEIRMDGQSRGGAFGRIRGGGGRGPRRGAVDVEVVMEVEEAVVVKRYLLKILMPSWRSTMQKQCKSKTLAVLIEIPTVA